MDAVIDPKLPVSQGMRTSDMVKSMVGLLSLGQSDFEAIEPFRNDRFFKEALGLSKVSSSAWMRQRLDAKGAELRDACSESSVRRCNAPKPITAHQGYVWCDIDTFGTPKNLLRDPIAALGGARSLALYLPESTVPRFRARRRSPFLPWGQQARSIAHGAPS